MSSRVASTFAVAVAVADCRPARDRKSPETSGRNAALLGIHPSICPGGPHVSFLWLCNECQAGTGADGELATSERRLCGNRRNTGTHSPRRPADSSGAGASPTDQTVAEHARADQTSSERSLYSTQPTNQTTINIRNPSIQLALRWKSKSSVASGRVASWDADLKSLFGTF